jgi:hypothetical protein
MCAYHLQRLNYATKSFIKKKYCTGFSSFSDACLMEREIYLALLQIVVVSAERYPQINHLIVAADFWGFP